MALAATEV